MATQTDSNTPSISSNTENTKPAGTLRGGFMLVLVVKPACPQWKLHLLIKAADELGLIVFNRSDPKKNTLIFLREDPARPGIFPFQFLKGVDYDPEHYVVQIQSSRELWRDEDGTVSRVAIASLERTVVKPFASEDAISPQHREAGVLSRHGSTEGLVIITSTGFLANNGRLLTNNTGTKVSVIGRTEHFVKVEIQDIAQWALWDGDIFGKILEDVHQDIRQALEKKQIQHVKTPAPREPVVQDEPGDDVGNRVSSRSNSTSTPGPAFKNHGGARQYVSPKSYADRYHGK